MHWHERTYSEHYLLDASGRIVGEVIYSIFDKCYIAKHEDKTIGKYLSVDSARLAVEEKE